MLRIEEVISLITIRKEIQSEIMMFTMEELVPEDSLLRKVNKYIDFSFINKEVKHLYSNDNGRPSVEPVVLFKIVFIQYLYGIKSMRETCRKINTDAEYRWFLNIPFGHKTPHFSTFSKNYERRFKDNEIFEKIMINIVKQAELYGLVEGKRLFTDSTHKKANANKNKYSEEVEKTVKKRRLWLEEEINEERRNNGEREFNYKDEEEEKHIKVSTTDKESGYYHRDNKEKGFMYLDHRTTDGKSNIIVDCYITKGNVHDSGPYIERMEYIKKTYGFKIMEVALDSGYATMEIKNWIKDNDIFGVIGYRRYGSNESRKKKSKYKYIKELDIYMNNETGEVLEYSKHIDKLGYKRYTNIEKDIIIHRHLKEELNEEFKNNRLSKEGKELYKLRKEYVERSFADSKCNHGFRYAMHKGIKKNQHYTWLSCSAQNMKNIAIKIDKLVSKKSLSTPLSTLFFKITSFFRNFRTRKNLVLNIY